MDSNSSSSDVIEECANSYEKVYMVPTHHKSYTFKKDYPANFVDHLLSKEKWKEIIEQSEKVMIVCCREKRERDLINIPKIMVILACVSIGLLVGFFFSICLYTASDEENEYLKYFSIICMSASNLLGIALATCNYCKKVRDFVDLDDILKENMDEYLKKMNDSYNNKIIFGYSKEKKWIECNLLIPKKRS